MTSKLSMHKSIQNSELNTLRNMLHVHDPENPCAFLEWHDSIVSETCMRLKHDQIKFNLALVVCFNCLSLYIVLNFYASIDRVVINTQMCVIK